MNPGEPVKSAKSQIKPSRKTRTVRSQKRSGSANRTRSRKSAKVTNAPRTAGTKIRKRASGRARRASSKRNQRVSPSNPKRIQRPRKLHPQKQPRIKRTSGTEESLSGRNSDQQMIQSLKWVEEDPKDHLLSRFIYDRKGNSIGESIGVEGRRLIMKSGKKFYSIPLNNIKEREIDLAIRGSIDKKMARKLGEVWRKKALDPLYQKNL